VSSTFHSDAETRAKLAELAAVARHLPPDDRRYAETLIKKGASDRGIRDISFGKVERLWREACRTAVFSPRETVQVGHAPKVIALLSQAARNHPLPIITFYRGRQGVALKPVSPTSKLPGVLDITAPDDGPWYGRLGKGGEFVKAREQLPEDVDQAIALMLEFARDPKAAAKRSAAETGRCVFCDSALGEDDEERGWHQHCAYTWGLPL
jgi:hypothetical protein